MFNEDQLVEILRLSTQEKLSSRKISRQYNCSKSTINYFLRRRTYKEFWVEYDNKPIAGGFVNSPLTKRTLISEITDKKTFLFTSAQNNTHVHDRFWKALNVCAEHKNAEIIVGSFTYNKSGFQNSTKDNTDLWFDPKIRDHLYDYSIQITDDLVFSGELNILPTAKRVFSGMSSYTGHNSMIVPHAKVQLEPVPNAKHHDVKNMYSTGCVTLSNYIQKKAGQIAAFNHIYAALLVEVAEDGTWFARQLNAETETGNFYDLDVYYTSAGYTTGNTIACLNLGDIHAAKLDPDAADVSWRNEDSMVNLLLPKYVFLHDVLDQQARNHHNVKDPYFLFKMMCDQTESVKEEITQTSDLINEFSDVNIQVVVVESNHDLALQRWLKTTDYRYDPVNAELFLELQLQTYKNIRLGNSKDFSVFEYSCNMFNDLSEVLFLKTDESFVLHNIEFGSHGDHGNNGARGSVSSFIKSGAKMNLGHSHSAFILDGVYYAGVLGNLDQGYNIGNSSWSHSNIITYNNGKRAIVQIKNRRYKVE